LDVGLQRLLKSSAKRSTHRNLVDEATQQIDAGKVTHVIQPDITRPALPLSVG
ncbi:hypothetical protein B0H19DRAFT_963328, partial [Mycena capillaripes]